MADTQPTTDNASDRQPITETQPEDNAPKGYVIYYSLDGSEATDASIRYTQPFAIEAPSTQGGSVTLHAIAIKSSDTMHREVQE